MDRQVWKIGAGAAKDPRGEAACGPLIRECPANVRQQASRAN
ncbi:hypothetical protein [Paenibacillus puerhi]|nr:hypothetical protein [Paenibacillus puerhi]